MPVPAYFANVSQTFVLTRHGNKLLVSIIYSATRIGDSHLSVRLIVPFTPIISPMIVNDFNS